MTNKVKKIDDHRWEIELEEDPAHPGELLMQMPQEALNQMGWDFGDELIWHLDENTQLISLTKKV